MMKKLASQGPERNYLFLGVLCFLSSSISQCREELSQIEKQKSQNSNYKVLYTNMLLDTILQQKFPLKTVSLVTGLIHIIISLSFWGNVREQSTLLAFSPSLWCALNTVMVTCKTDFGKRPHKAYYDFVPLVVYLCSSCLASLLPKHNLQIFNVTQIQNDHEYTTSSFFVSTHGQMW